MPIRIAEGGRAMADSLADRQLLAVVQAQINQGKKTISVPAGLLTEANDLARDEVRRLCRLCGVKVEVRVAG